METLNPWRTGASLAITMAISYSVCAVLYALWPDRAIAFLNALFHGLDFGKLATPAPSGVATFVYPLAVLTAWGFLVGAVFGWVHGLLSGRAARQ